MEACGPTPARSITAIVEADEMIVRQAWVEELEAERDRLRADYERLRAALEHVTESEERLIAELERAVEVRENANAVTSRVEGRLRRLQDAIEEYVLWEPGRAGHAAAHRRLLRALEESR